MSWSCVQASSLPEAVDNAWSSIGGGPSDLTFPELFLGTWRVQATLTKVETPLGPEYVPDMKVNRLSHTRTHTYRQRALFRILHWN